MAMYALEVQEEKERVEMEEQDMLFLAECDRQKAEEKKSEIFWAGIHARIDNFTPKATSARQTEIDEEAMDTLMDDDSADYQFDELLSGEGVTE